MTYYEVLGIPENAGAADIRAAYRKAAASVHPDKNPAGEALFKVLTEAHSVLSDPVKRAEYDRSRKVAQMPAPAPMGAAGTIDLTKLAQAFMPADLYRAAGPALERVLEQKGIDPKAASVVQLLESVGVLKKGKKQRAG
jgi:molecular chaperone DnaJ